METQLNIAANTVLRMVSEANLGTDASGYFRKHDDIASELDETNESLQPFIMASTAQI